MTTDEVGAAVGVDARTVRLAESGRGGGDTAPLIQLVLVGRGVRFTDDGLVAHADGRIAPTRRAVGKFHGYRIRWARHRLAWAPRELSTAARIGYGALMRMEAGHDLEAKPTLGFYRVIGALQLAGNVFAPRTWRGSGTADRCLVERPQVWDENRNRIRDYVGRPPVVQFPDFEG